MNRFFKSLSIMAAITLFMTACRTAPATAEPMVITPTQQAVATATLIMPTPTPIITEIVTTTAEQLAGSWKWSTLGSARRSSL